MKIIWCMVPEIWAIFCPLTLLTTWKMKVLKKWNKHLKILSFYTCIPQMMIIWCIVPEIWSTTDRTYLSFWAMFCTFTPLTTQKIKILKKWKQDLEISSFYTSVLKIMIICYIVPGMMSNGCKCYFSFWAIFCPFISLTPWKIKILKKWKI